MVMFKLFNQTESFDLIQVDSTGAIIRDGDCKSWDARGPMIRDNFSIFRTNCAILTSYIRADLRTCRGSWMFSRYVMKW